MRIVALIVSVERGGGTNDLVVLAVRALNVNPDGDRLVCLVGDDDALTLLLDPGDVFTRRGRSALMLGCLVLGPLLRTLTRPRLGLRLAQLGARSLTLLRRSGPIQ